VAEWDFAWMWMNSGKELEIPTPVEGMKDKVAVFFSQRNSRKADENKT